MPSLSTLLALAALLVVGVTALHALRAWFLDRRD
jgi:hypothetical protein